MFQVGEYVVYKRDVCKVDQIKKNHLNNNDYYILIPVFDNTLKIEIPVDFVNLRALITKEEVENFISQIPNIEALENDNRVIENEYKMLMKSGKHSDLIKIIKTAYLRNKERIDNKKKIGDRDNDYFNNKIDELGIDDIIIRKLNNYDISIIMDLWKLKRNDLKKYGLNVQEINQVIVKMQLLGIDLNKKIYARK